MSQYPSLYSPPPYPRNPGYYAKRAGLLMIIVGIIAILFSLRLVGVAQMVRTTGLPPELAAQMQQMESKGIKPEMVFVAMGVAFFIFAVSEIVLGFFVRAGKTAAIILSLVGTSIVLILFGFLVLAAALSAEASMAPQTIAGLMIWFVVIGLLVLQLIWLIAAARAGRQAALAQQQYQGQYWQYQQNMQAYGGYAPPPPIPVPPPVPPKPGENAER